MSKINIFKMYHNGQGKLMNNTNAPSFKTAMKEMNSNQGKQGHWSWYIMPTNKGSRQFNNKFKLTRHRACSGHSLNHLKRLVS